MNSQDRQDDAPAAITMRARNLFERASTQLDSRTANALRLARREALAPSRPVRRSAWIPAGAAMTAVLAVGLSWWLPQQSAVAPAATGELAAVSALNPALAVDDDAELYAWLGDAPVAVDPANGSAL